MTTETLSRPAFHGLCGTGAAMLAREVAARRISAREAVEEHIRRIEEVNAAINAIVARRFELARAEADAIDRRNRLPCRWSHRCGVRTLS